MTTIVRKGSMIASDSKFVNTFGTQHAHVYYRGEKFYILPEGTAVIGLSGTITNRASFNKMIGLVRSTILAMETNETLPEDYSPETNGDDASIMVATKSYTLIGRIVEGNISTWTELAKDTPTIIGSGSGCIMTNDLINPSSTAVDVVRSIMDFDNLSGGKIYTFDLNNLKSQAGEV